jgi:general secretion pathway protein F
MTTFIYRAVDAQGAAQVGQIESDTRSGALDALAHRGLLPIQIDEVHSRARVPSLQIRSFWVRSPARLEHAELVAITESLAALTKAGLTIDRALGITAELKKHRPCGRSVAELARAVRSGQGFALALESSGMSLPRYYVGMVNAGEVGGSLPATLARLGELLRREHQVREKVRSALVYPALLAGMVVLTVVLLLAVVLPRFQALFAESEAPLPWSTRLVLSVGGFVSAHGWILLLVGIVAIAMFVALLRHPRGRAALDGWLVRTPLMLGLPASIDSARMLRCLGTLASNGIPLASAIRIARTTLANSRLRAAFEEVARRVNAGESTSAAFASVAHLPAQVVQLARVGEETGRLPEMLQEAATILELETYTLIERLLALLVPVLTIVMGLVIAAMIGSVLVGLLSVNDLAF